MEPRENEADDIRLVPPGKFGTSREYVLSRLARDASEDNEDEEDRHLKAALRDRVVSGEMTAHRAAIEAGFRREPIRVARDPLAAAKALRKHFRGEQLAELVAALNPPLVPCWFRHGRR